MEKKAKKPLTVNQLKNRHVAYQYLYHGGEYFSILAPYIVVGGVNFNEWFVYNPEGWKVGLGGSLALALIGIATFLVSKNKEDKKASDGYIALIVGWFMMAFVFMLLSSIMNEIATIMFYGGIGLCGAFGFDLASKNEKKKVEIYKDAMKEAQKDTIKEKVKKEIEKESGEKVVF